MLSNKYKLKIMKMFWQVVFSMLKTGVDIILIKKFLTYNLGERYLVMFELSKFNQYRGDNRREVNKSQKGVAGVE